MTNTSDYLEDVIDQFSEQMDLLFESTKTLHKQCVRSESMVNSLDLEQLRNQQTRTTAFLRKRNEAERTKITLMKDAYISFFETAHEGVFKGFYEVYQKPNPTGSDALKFLNEQGILERKEWTKLKETRNDLKHVKYGQDAYEFVNALQDVIDERWEYARAVTEEMVQFVRATNRNSRSVDEWNVIPDDYPSQKSIDDLVTISDRQIIDLSP